MVTQQEHERARDDAKISNDLARMGAQSAILINGGAATAILAFMGSISRDNQIAKAILPLFPIPLFSYAVGVFCAAMSLLVMSRSIESYMMWHLGEKSREPHATRLWNLGLGLVTLGLVCFAGASAYLAVGLARAGL